MLGEGNQLPLFQSLANSANKPGVRRSDPLDRLSRAAADHGRAATKLEAAVLTARQAGHSWRAIGRAAGLPFQTLARRYGPKAGSIRAADPDQMPSDDDETPRNVTQLAAAEQAADGRGRHLEVGAVQSQDGDSGVGPRRIAPDITEVAIQSDQETTFSPGGVEDIGIRSTLQTLVNYRIDVVAKSLGRDLGRGGHVLVELDPQPWLGSNG